MSPGTSRGKLKRRCAWASDVGARAASRDPRVARVLRVRVGHLQLDGVGLLAPRAGRHEDAAELLPEVLTEDAVEHGIRSRVHVAHGGHEDEEHPRRVERFVGKGVVEQQDLVRGVGDEVDDNGGDQHLDHALARLDGVRRLLLLDATLRHDHLLPVQVLRPREQVAPYDDVTRDLQHHGNQVEDAEFQVLEGDQVLDVVAGETEGAEADVEVRRGGDEAVVEHDREREEQHDGPDDADDDEHPLPAAEDVRLHRVNDRDVPAARQKCQTCIKAGELTKGEMCVCVCV